MIPTEILVGFFGMAGSAVVALFGYKRGRKADAEANENAANAAIYAGYGGLTQRLQEDNADLRRQLVEAKLTIVTLLKEKKERNHT